MVQLTTIKGVELKILIGDGASPEVFTHPCMINTERGVSWAATGTDEEIPDCDDPGGMAWNETVKTSRKGTINGAGKFDADPTVFQMLWEWWMNDEIKNVKISYGDLFTISGEWKLMQFDQAGARGTVATASMQMVSNGPQLYEVAP